MRLLAGHFLCPSRFGKREISLTKERLKALEDENAKLKRLLAIEREIFETMDDARRKLALWRYGYNTVRPHASLGNQTPQPARERLSKLELRARRACPRRGTRIPKCNLQTLAMYERPAGGG